MMRIREERQEGTELSLSLFPKAAQKKDQPGFRAWVTFLVRKKKKGHEISSNFHRERVFKQT